MFPPFDLPKGFRDAMAESRPVEDCFPPLLPVAEEDMRLCVRPRGNQSVNSVSNLFRSQPRSQNHNNVRFSGKCSLLFRQLCENPFNPFGQLVEN